MGREPPPVLSLGFPRSAPKFLPLAKAESPKRGEYITVFAKQSKFFGLELRGLLTGGLAKCARRFEFRSPRGLVSSRGTHLWLLRWCGLFAQYD